MEVNKAFVLTDMVLIAAYLCLPPYSNFSSSTMGFSNIAVSCQSHFSWILVCAEGVKEVHHSIPSLPQRDLTSHLQTPTYQIATTIVRLSLHQSASQCTHTLNYVRNSFTLDTPGNSGCPHPILPSIGEPLTTRE